MQVFHNKNIIEFSVHLQAIGCLSKIKNIKYVKYKLIQIKRDTTTKFPALRAYTKSKY